MKTLDELYESMKLSSSKVSSTQHAWIYHCKLTHNGNSEVFEYTWGKGLDGKPDVYHLIASLLADWDALDSCSSVIEFQSEFGYEKSSDAAKVMKDIRTGIAKLRNLFTDEELDILKGTDNE